MKNHKFDQVTTLLAKNLGAILVGTVCWLNPTTGSAQVILNGSFESGVMYEPGYTVNAGSNEIEHWTINGWVDYYGTFWQAGDGQRSIDLSAAWAGSISQLITTLDVGQTYRIDFLLSGNPGYPGENNDPIKTMELSVGLSSEQYSFDTTGFSFENMGWSPRHFDFVASASSMLLTLTSLEDNPYGPAVDAFSIEVIPEPTVASFALAAALVFGLRNRVLRT